MAGTDAFQVEGVVLEALANGTYRLELANGHRLLGFVAGRARKPHPGFAPGETVNLAANLALTSHWTVFARIDNLFDRRYENPVGFLQPALGVFAGVRGQL